MAWWRRDPSLSPVHRYAQRLLRSHDATLRSRCFSRTPEKAAQHEDDDHSRRPAGMTNLEWMQWRHIRRWRKRLENDPYQALFGASNDMLNGKGLKDWDWISRSFPKWMLTEMDVPEDAKNKRDKDQDGRGNYNQVKTDNKDKPSSQPTAETSTSASSRFPKRVAVEDNDGSRESQGGSHFPQPSFRKPKLWHDDRFGVTSPSDSRRPREQSGFDIGRTVSSGQTSRSAEREAAIPASTTNADNAPIIIPPRAPEKDPDPLPYDMTPEAAAAIRESTFIEQFLAEAPQTRHSMDRTWRQTSLDRRLASGAAIKKDMLVPPQVEVVSGENPSSFGSGSDPAKSSLARSLDPKHETYNAEDETMSAVKWLFNNDQPVVKATSQPEPSTENLVRSTSKVLDQLPKDDIDFLSADEIRASMGAKKSRTLSEADKKAKKQSLEDSFKQVHDSDHFSNSMIESKCLNDKFIRRVERRLQETNEANETPLPIGAKPAAVSEAPQLSSLEVLKSWIDSSGAAFASYFWQDPTEEADAIKTRLFFDKVVGRIRKSRVALKQVVEDLENDIPAAKPLLKRLQDDEGILDAKIHALRVRSGSDQSQPMSQRKMRKILGLRRQFQDTDRELNAAFEAIKELENTEAIKSVSPAFKRRLRIASKICHKSAHLSRYLIWSLQARFEDPNVDIKRLVHYKAFADSLLTLRDTQLALARVVDCAMVTYDVAPISAGAMDFLDKSYCPESSLDTGKPTEPQETAIVDHVNTTRIRADIAAEERLANEVEAQKAAMQGLSDDGYARMPKPAPKRTFDERSPLVNSLFRPFGPVFESLGKETAAITETTVTEDLAKKKLHDATLVSEIRQAYEDTYGPITVDHRQVSSADEDNVRELDSVKSFEMLKDDPTNFKPEITSSKPDTNENPLEAEFPISAEATTQNLKDSSEIASKEDDSSSVMWTVSETANRLESSTKDAPTLETPVTATDESLPLDAITSSSESVDLPTYYTIMVYNSQKDALSLTTSMSAPPRDTSPAIPLHEALATLNEPSKFVPHITEGMEIVTAKKDMLILRSALQTSATPTRAFETISTSPTPSSSSLDHTGQEKHHVNPIDGTARLSPTGYVGPEESREQLGRDFEERKQAADRFNVENLQRERRAYREKQKGAREKRRGTASGVIKTAIWATVVCYVVGVFGEIATGPFRV